jgi:hypothetical protein
MNLSASRVAAAAWSLLFAVVHVWWATGSTLLLGPAAAGRVHGWFLAYDLGAALACLVAMVLAVWAGRRWLVVVALVVGLRGLLGVGQAVLVLLQGGTPVTPTFWVEPFFVLGAVLFAVAARSTRQPAVATSTSR